MTDDAAILRAIRAYYKDDEEYSRYAQSWTAQRAKERPIPPGLSFRLFPSILSSRFSGNPATGWECLKMLPVMSPVVAMSMAVVCWEWLLAIPWEYERPEMQPWRFKYRRY